MEYIETLLQRNEEFSKADFVTGLKMLPKKKTMIIGCVDPRVDPADVFKMEPGEAAIIRNVGGRVNPAIHETLNTLQVVSKTAGQDVGPGWNIIVFHHTHCGIVNCLHHSPELIAQSFGVGVNDLSTYHVEDPYKAVAFDVEALLRHPQSPKGAMVTGLVYDVETGLVKKVVGPQVI